MRSRPAVERMQLPVVVYTSLPRELRGFHGAVFENVV